MGRVHGGKSLLKPGCLKSILIEQEVVNATHFLDETIHFSSRKYLKNLLGKNGSMDTQGILLNKFTGGNETLIWKREKI
jgi:hypothetical protein